MIFCLLISSFSLLGFFSFVSGFIDFWVLTSVFLGGFWGATFRPSMPSEVGIIFKTIKKSEFGFQKTFKPF